jgi:hypothetical protein
VHYRQRTNTLPKPWFILALTAAFMWGVLVGGLAFYWVGAG